MPSTRPRIHPYISEDCRVRLSAFAKRPGKTESQIVDQALAAFFSREIDDSRDAAILRRLDRMTRQFEALKRDQTIVAEMLALFVRYFLTLVPPVPEADKKAVKAQGYRRFETFMESLSTVLSDGDRILLRAMDDICADESAFFSEADLARLHRPAPAKASAMEAGDA